MKESLWAYWIVLLGLFVIVVMMLLQNYTTTNQQDYYLLKEITDASMHEAIDLAHYRKYGEIRIIKEKFVENFMRRFSESVNINKTYNIKFYDIYEAPPKASIKITTSTDQYSVFSDTDTLGVVNRLDAILEVIPSQSSATGGGSGGSGNSAASYCGNSSITVSGGSATIVTTSTTTTSQATTQTTTAPTTTTAQVSNLPFSAPIAGWCSNISSIYGDTYSGIVPYGSSNRVSRTTFSGGSTTHAGTDINFSRGTPVYAAGDASSYRTSGDSCQNNNCSTSHDFHCTYKSTCNSDAYTSGSDASCNGNAGKLIQLYHASGSPTNSMTTVYMHLDSYAIPATNGSQVSRTIKKGDLIGYVGSSGGYQCYDHLHYEVRTSGGSKLDARLYTNC